MNEMRIAAVLALVCTVACRGEEASGLSAPVSVDFGVSAQRVVRGGLCKLAYDPAWSSVAEEGAHVVIEAVTGLDTESPATTTVHTATADASGLVQMERSGEAVRLLHRIVSADGATTLDVMVRDLAFGVEDESDAIFADVTTDGLQRMADAHGVAPVFYDVAWTPGASSVRLDLVRTGLYAPHATTTNTLFSGTGAGHVDLPLAGAADCKLRLAALDAGGEETGAVLTASYRVWTPPATVILFR